MENQELIKKALPGLFKNKNVKVVDKAPGDKKKWTLLGASIAMDLIGCASFSIPVLGEVLDVIWAPIAMAINFAMFGGWVGGIGAVTTFFEELLPGTDFIPSFTLTWIAKYYIVAPEENSDKVENIEIIEVDEK